MPPPTLDDEGVSVFIYNFTLNLSSLGDPASRRAAADKALVITGLQKQFPPPSPPKKVEKHIHRVVPTSLSKSEYDVLLDTLDGANCVMNCVFENQTI